MIIGNHAPFLAATKNSAVALFYNNVIGMILGSEVIWPGKGELVFS
jgi:hypothetical protein